MPTEDGCITGLNTPRRDLRLWFNPHSARNSHRFDMKAAGVGFGEQSVVHCSAWLCISAIQNEGACGGLAAHELMHLVANIDANVVQALLQSWMPCRLFL